MDENKSSRVASRADKVGKKRKINRVYNILLGIVIVAIVVVLVTIFTGNDDDNQATSVEESRTQQQETKNIEETDEDTNSKEEESIEQSNDMNENEIIEEDENTIGNNDDSYLDETVEDGNWQPVGTTQTGEHVTDFTKGSTDWNEMERALAYGAGIDYSNMTVYWLGNGGAPDKAVGTVAPKDNSAQYRVHIEWVDGGGWKPYQVERIK